MWAVTQMPFFSPKLCALLAFLILGMLTSLSLGESMKCFKCRAYKDLYASQEKKGTCDVKFKICYSIMQDDTVQQIVSKECAYKGFCDGLANSIPHLTYCKECNTTGCNTESDFPTNVFPDLDAATRGEINLLLIISTVVVLLLKACAVWHWVEINTNGKFF